MNNIKLKQQKATAAAVKLQKDSWREIACVSK